MWPSPEELDGVGWAQTSIAPGYPTFAEMVERLRPIARAGLLLGRQVDGFMICLADDGSPWTHVDLASLTVTSNVDHARSRFAGFTIDFIDGDLVDVLTGESCAVAGVDLPVLGGAGNWTDNDQSIETAIATLATDAADALAPFVSAGAPERMAGTGALWILDPTHWDDATSLVAGDIDAARAIFQPDYLQVSVVNQVLGHVDAAGNQVATLDRSLRVVGREEDARKVWDIALAALTARGERHRLNELEEYELMSHGSGRSWLDSVIVALRRGVIEIGDLFVPPPSPDPIAAVALDDATLELVVWRRETIRLTKRHPAGAPIAGCVAWDYAHGDASHRPTVIVVAGRGVEIDASSRLRQAMYDEPLHPSEAAPIVLDLAIFRVQHDDLVPPQGGVIDPQLRVAPAFINEPQRPKRQVLLKPKPDGVVVMYPVVDNDDRPERGPLDDDVIRAVIELKVDPFSADDWYEIDVEMYHYQGLPNMPPATAAHVVVRATENVEIISNRSDFEDGLALQAAAWWAGVDLPAEIGKGIVANTAAADLFYNFYFDAWAFSAETWRVVDVGPQSDGLTSLSPWDALGAPFERELPVFAPAMYRDQHSSRPRLTTTRELTFGNTTVTAYRDGDIDLLPASHRYEVFGYRDSMMFDAMDLLVGFVPIAGDAVDIAEAVHAWRTGRDKWGRPVTDFQLSLMLIGASVPFLSNGFVGAIGDAISAAGGALRSGLFDDLMTRRALPVLDEAGDDLADSAAAVMARRSDRSWTDTITHTISPPATQMANELTSAPAAMTTLASRVVVPGATTLTRVGDVATDAGTGSSVYPVSIALRRAARDAPSPPTVPGVLDSRVSDTVWLVGKGLVRNLDEIRPRLALPRGMYPSEMRAFVRGAATDPGTWSDQQFIDNVGAAFDLIQQGGPAGRIVSGGALHQATDVVADGQVLLSRLPVLLAAAAQHGDPSLSPIVKLAGGGTGLSDGERSLRVAKALYSAAGELSDHSLGVAGDLFSPTMLPATREFVQKFVVRYGWEHGLRFELRQTSVVEALVGVTGGVRHQLELPSLAGARLANGAYRLLSGPDTIIYLNGKAYFVQYKAYINMQSLFSTALRIRSTGGRVVKVTGAAFPKQHVTDHLRVDHLGRQVANAAGDGLVDVGDRSLHVFDDVHLMNNVVSLIIEAAQRTGKGRISILNDVKTSERTREALATAVGDSYRVTDDIYDDITVALEAIIEVEQEAVNQYLRSQPAVDVLGRPTEIIYQRATDLITDAPHLLLGRPL